MSEEKTNRVEDLPSRQKVCQIISALGSISLVVPGLVSANTEHPSSENGSPPEHATSKNGSPKEQHEELEGPNPKEENDKETFSEDAKKVPKDDLPIPSEEISSEVSAMALPECVGIPLDSVFEAEVCPKDDGSLEASIGALGIVAETVTIEPGQATRSASVRASIPGVGGVLQEFSFGWDAEWAGTTIESLSLELEVEAWEFGSDWYTIASFDEELIG